MATTSPTGGTRGRDEDATEFAYRMLRSDILNGALTPGSTLSQAQLARDLGISRTPLREALRRLAAEHLVSGNFNQRMRVSELDLEDLDQIYAMRIALEPVAVRATLPLDRPSRTALSRQLAKMAAAIEDRDLERFRREHRDFDMGIIAGTGTRMRTLLATLWDQAERYRLAYLTNEGVAGEDTLLERLRVSQEEHEAILKAALTDDVEACTNALVTHLERTVKLLFLDTVSVPKPQLSQAAAERHVTGTTRLP
ncbi:GntR family transcriptional regulator [Sphaerisporangium sp. NPDC051017]|uniref:GntR family transcriptional regulator n=1 Tax=Sphaerisporangium sp. NPDC051017 TaxID=3154636 RepID=UPI003418BC67